MPASRRQYEVVSVSLPRDLVRRANAVIPKARRSRVIAHMLTSFLGSIERKQMERAYETYYSQRSGREAKEERDLLADWKITDDEVWAILEKDNLNGRHKAR
jgi:metal-responsive CopG/Arc/MetJ family transcriptional regulator